MKKIFTLLSLALSSICIAQPYFSGQIFFESQPIEGLTIAPDTNNQWQIGSPDKTVFTNALSGINSIVTDTVQKYIPGKISVFVLDMVKYLTHDTFALGWYDVSFTHSMNVDSLAGGTIEISYDSLNWYNIFKPQILSDSFGIVCYNNAIIDTLYNNDLGFASSFNNSVVSFMFGWQAVRSNNNFSDAYTRRPFIKFTFMSDSLSEPNDGWMIDNFYLGATTPSSVSESLSKSITLYPNPANDKLAFDFDGNKFKPTELTITNVLGQRILEAPFSKTVDISTLQQGIYYITLTDDKGNSAAKMFYKQ